MSFRFLRIFLLLIVAVSASWCRAGSVFDPILGNPRQLQPQATLASPSKEFVRDGHEGESVALNARFAVVSVPFDVFAVYPNAGHVKVFDPESGELRFTLTNPDSSPNARLFGAAVALSNSLLFIGAPENTERSSEQGVVYVYDLDGHNPTEPVRTLHAPDWTGPAFFGSELAVDGDRLIVGSPAGLPLTPHGKAYVFDFASPTPDVPTHILERPVPLELSAFGHSVAISGSRVAVGSKFSDPASNRAVVYIFDLQPDGGTTLVASLVNPGVVIEFLEDVFGRAIAMEGNNLMVGAGTHDSVEPTPRAYLYDLAGATPDVPKVTFRGEIANGLGVALQGNRAFVGASGVDTFVSEYDLAGTSPGTPVRVIAEPNSNVPFTRFGAALSVYGDRLLVGAPDENRTAWQQGAAYLFDAPAGSATALRATFSRALPWPDDRFGSTVISSGTRLFVAAPGTDIYDKYFVAMYDFALASGRDPIRIFPKPFANFPLGFGEALAATGDRLIVGATKSDTVAVYDLASASSDPHFHLTNPTPGSSGPVEGFGKVLAVSGDWLAVSIRADLQTSADGIVYVYNLSSATPNTPVHEIRLQGGQTSRFGSALAMEGSRLVVGAPLEQEGIADYAGAVYVYDLNAANPTTPQRRLTPGKSSRSYFGAAIALSNGKLAVASPSTMGSTFDERLGSWVATPVGSLPGNVKIFDLDSETPAQALATFQPTASSSQFPLSIAFAGTRLAMGHRGAYESRPVEIFNLANSENTPVAEANPPSSATENRLGFGSSIAFIGDSLAVGIPGKDSIARDKGEVALYGEPPGTPSATIGPVFAITFTSATVPVAINPAWLELEFQLQYRRSTAGESAEPFTTVASFRPYGGSPVSIEVPIVHLTPGENYELRVFVPALAGELTSKHFFTTPDLQPPQVRPPVSGFTPLVLTGDSSPLPDYTQQATASDAAGLVSFEQAPPPGTLLPIGVHRVTLTATDVGGAASSLSFSIRVRPENGVGPGLIAAAGEPVLAMGTQIVGIPEGAVWTRFEEPAIGDSGSLAVVGHWRAESEKGSVLTLIKPDGDRIVRAHVGGSTIYHEARIRALRDPLLASDDGMIFSATLDGADGKRIGAQAICWLDAYPAYPIPQSDPIIVARTDMPVPGLVDATFQSFDAAAVAAGGHVLIRARIKRGKEVTSRNDEILLHWGRISGELTSVLREGQPFADFGKIVNFRTLRAGAVSAGASRGWLQDEGAILPLSLGIGTRGVINVSATFEDGVTRFLSIRDNEVHELSANGGAEANTGFATVGLPSFRADPKDGVAFPAATADRAGVFCAVDLSANATNTVFFTDATAPLTSKIGRVHDVVAAPFGRLEAWIGRMAARQGPLSNRTFLAGSEEGLNVKVLAWVGQEAAGCSVGERWKAFKSIACPGEGVRALFVASLAGRGVTPARDRGVWSIGLDDAPHLLLREGDTVQGRVVKSFNTLSANALCEGAARTANSMHQVAVLLTFRDNTTGIAVLDVR